MFRNAYGSKIGGVAVLALSTLAASALASGKDQERDQVRDAAASGTSITFGAATAHLGIEYRVDLTHDDRGLERVNGQAPNGTTDLSLAALKIMLEGEARRNLAYAFIVDPRVTTDPVEVAKVIWSPAKGLAVTVGKDYVNEGGFEAKHWVYDTVAVSPYLESWVPLATSEPMFAAQLDLLGRLTMQVTEDTRPAGTGQGEEAATPGRPLQPALSLEWLGDFGAVAPLIQLGSYGDGNSRYGGLGLQLDTKDLTVAADYIVDVRQSRYGTGRASQKLASVYQSAVLMGEWRGLKVASPFFKVARLTVAEPNAADLELEDRSVNTQNADGSVLLDDNGTVAAVGAKFPVQGDDFVPYVELQMTQGSFAQSPTSDQVETRSGLQIHFGISGAL